MPHDTIVQRLLDHADRRPDALALFEKRDGVWKSHSFRAYADLVKRAARAMIASGFEPGDTTCILGKNRLEWVVFDVATMAAGGAPAGIYTTSSPSEVAYVVGHAESKLVLVEDAEQWAKIEQKLGELPKLELVVLMRGAPSIEHPKVVAWEAFLERARDVSEERLLERVHALEPGGLATFIYTSGTTGPPKGVMLSHQNLAFTASLAQRLGDLRPSDCSLSYLPLSHIAEQVFTIHGPITAGASVYFAESLEKVPDNLKEVQPTVFFGVPRIWEKFHAGIAAKLRDAKGAKKQLVAWARRVGTSVTALRMKGKEPSGLLAAEYALAKRLVFDKLKPAIGLGRARFCVSGAAPIAKEVLEFFGSLDILVLEVYGQSEDTGPTSFNLPGRCRFGTVGPAMEGVEVKIADDGEILVRGPNVFLGYYKEPEATAETLKDGWLHSGDLGAFDADGFLSITGRKKEILITAGGKNIAPKNIESALKNHPIIGEAVVIGDRRKYLTCLVTLDPDAAKAFAAERGLSVEALPTSDADRPKPPPGLAPLAPAAATAAAAERGLSVEALPKSDAVRQEIQAAIDEVNRDLARVETVKKFVVLERPFSVDSGELTPTLKVKRKVVNERFAAEIEAMYGD